MIQVGVNSYISLEDANNYFSSRLYATAWTSAQDKDKENALIMATKRINQLKFAGRKVNNDQPLEFPRVLSVLWQDSTVKVVTLDVPPVVADAVCEEALAILENSEREKLRREGVESFVLGELSERYTGPVRGVCPAAYDLIKPYLVKGVWTV